MSYLDKTFCASPRCQNQCGRRMTDLERDRLTYLNYEQVSYGYFCGEEERRVPINLKSLRMENISEAEFKKMYAQEPKPIDERNS